MTWHNYLAVMSVGICVLAPDIYIEQPYLIVIPFLVAGLITFPRPLLVAAAAVAFFFFRAVPSMSPATMMMASYRTLWVVALIMLVVHSKIKFTSLAAWVCIGNSILTHAMKLAGFEQAGLLNNPSLNAAMNVWLMLEVPNPWLMVLPLSTLITQGGMTAYIIAGIYLLALIFKSDYKWHGALFLFMVAVFGYYYVGWTDSERFPMYQAAWRYFVDGHQWLMGYGFGSYAGLSPKVQALSPLANSDGLWFSLHSDLLQLLFECGIFGVFIFGVIAIRLLGYMGIGEKLESLGFLVMAAFYFPTQVPVLLFLFLVLLADTERQAGYENVL